MRSRPLVVLALAGALLVAACGGDRSGGKDGDEGPSVYGADTTTTAAEPAPADPNSKGATAGTPTTAARTGTTNRPPGGRATTTTAAPANDGGGGPPATEPAPGSGDVRPTATDDGSQGPPGAFARTLLRPQPATAIVLERAAQTGASIAPAAVNRSAGVVAEVAGKPVDVRPQATISSTDTDWTADEVRATADSAAGRVPQGNGKAVLRLLLLKGTFEGSQDVLGVAVRGDVLAVFVDNIAGAATPLVSRQAIEDAVLLHELGHVLGLVDLARNTGRADKEHPGHSSNSASVMYWAVESSLIGQVISGPPPRDFDAEDLADLRALRDGA